MCTMQHRFHDDGGGVEDHPRDEAGMTCIMKSLNSAAPTGPAQQPQGGSSGHSQ